jgi:ribosomal protein L13
MGYRKFSYDDVVTIVSGSDYETHVGHVGRVVATRVAKRKDGLGTKVNYHVSCACGKNLIPEASQMDIVSERNLMSVHESRMMHFVQLAGITPDKSILKKQVHQALNKAVSGFIRSFDKGRHRDLLIRHFGLDGEPSKSQLELAEEEQVSQQRMQAMLSRVLNNLRKEKHG